jgi:hypothetical protein
MGSKPAQSQGRINCKHLVLVCFYVFHVCMEDSLSRKGVNGPAVERSDGASRRQVGNRSALWRPQQQSQQQPQPQVQPPPARALTCRRRSCRRDQY